MRILLADDHVLFRSGMRYILADLDSDMTIQEVGSGEDLVRAAREQPYDLVLMDMLMPGMNQCDVIGALKDLQPELPIVIISMLDSPGIIRSAVAAGASGFIPKTSTSEIMTEAIRLVLAGGVYLPPAVLGREEDNRSEDEEPAAVPIEAHLTR